MEEIRCFVAVELPHNINEFLAQLGARLKAGSPRPVKWVDPQGIHLTLKFLGNVPSARIAEIGQALNGATGGKLPLMLHTGGLGAFPGWQRPQVVWLGLEGDLEGLARLQSDVDAALSALGFPAEGRAFTPHLTLARVREGMRPDDRKQLADSTRSVALPLAAAFMVRSVSLIRSRLTPSGALYTRLMQTEMQPITPPA